MKKGILGRKIGMTQVFTESGKLIPVTVVAIEPNVVTQIKTIENDGYEAIQLGFDTKREKLATKASIGHTNKANTTPKRFFREIKGVEISNYSLGQEIKADIFAEGEIVDVTGTTKGHGFQGVIKRHNQSRGPMGHGSHYHRRPGSMGTMAVDVENNVILVKGNVPGAKHALVIIKSAIKNTGKVNEREELISYVETPIEQPTESKTEEDGNVTSEVANEEVEATTSENE